MREVSEVEGCIWRVDGDNMRGLPELEVIVNCPPCNNIIHPPPIPPRVIRNMSSVQHDAVGALVQWVNLPAWKVRDRGVEPHSGIQVSKKQKMFLPQSLVNIEFYGKPP